MSKKLQRCGLAAVLAVAILILALNVCGVSARPAQAIQADPGPGSVFNYKTVVFAAGTSAITQATYYRGGTSTGYLSQGWYIADVFVTVDMVTTTNTITVTPQVSADGVNWVDVQYLSEDWVLPLDYTADLSTTATVNVYVINTVTVTSTNAITTVQGTAGSSDDNTDSTSLSHSFTSASAERVSELVPYRIALAADGTDYVEVPLHGNYLRFSVALQTATAVTPTITAIFKNSAGR
jgi:hypothetical protein